MKYRYKPREKHWSENIIKNFFKVYGAILKNFFTDPKVQLAIESDNYEEVFKLWEKIYHLWSCEVPAFFLNYFAKIDFIIETDNIDELYFHESSLIPIEE